MARLLMFLLGGMFILLAMWCALWVLSSASLASQFCQSDFSLFHREFRCRQPYLGLIGGIVSFLAGGVCIWLSIKRKKVALGGNATK